MCGRYAPDATLSADFASAEAHDKHRPSLLPVALHGDIRGQATDAYLRWRMTQDEAIAWTAAHPGSILELVPETGEKRSQLQPLGPNDAMMPKPRVGQP